MKRTFSIPSTCFFLLCSLQGALAQSTWDFTRDLQQYFIHETRTIEEESQARMAAPAYYADSLSRQVQRQQLQEMLGLMPMPARTALKATLTGRLETDSFTVEKLHFQSMPGLYVTANFYLPKERDTLLPAILYVCGHATHRGPDGYNYGSKTHYQHHPAWFARNGYACLIIDTHQLGEIEGIHHGTYRYDRWWWVSRGFTPAGIETWNSIRAIDYLLSRPEVDPRRLGMTGRSGGGVYSWWVPALDDRVKVSVPVAGITDLRNYVIDGCIEGHCDCMFKLNTYRWDYPEVAAMQAPRPLLISNSDRDPIFPIDGVFRTYQAVRQVYERMDKPDLLALNTVAGGHKDVQALRVHAFQWLNQHLKGDDDLITKVATPFFAPEALRVFDQIPEDAVNTRIDGSFVHEAAPLSTQLEGTSWESLAPQLRQHLDQKVFVNWPAHFPAKWEKQHSWQTAEGPLSLWEVQTDPSTHLPAFEWTLDPQKNETLVVVLDETSWPEWQALLAPATGQSFAPFWDREQAAAAPASLPGWTRPFGKLWLISPRGTGPASFSADKTTLTHIRRRYHLLGQTLHGMQTWDLRQFFHHVAAQSPAPPTLRAAALSATEAMYASIYVQAPLHLDLHAPMMTHMDGPIYPNILRFMDVPAGIFLAGTQHDLKITPRQAIVANEAELQKCLERIQPNNIRIVE